MSDETKEINTPDSIRRDKIIDHLTKEIEILTESTMTFRIRAAFTVWIGPFILLGSLIIATKGNFQLVTNNWLLMSVVILLVCGFYICLGKAAGTVEEQAWSQCDKWRKTIAKVASGELLDANDLYGALAFEGMKEKIKRAYIIVFVLILGSFICVTYIAAHVKAREVKVEQIDSKANKALHLTAQSLCSFAARERGR